jgi:hypothetical protein
MLLVQAGLVFYPLSLVQQFIELVAEEVVRMRHMELGKL